MDGHRAFGLGHERDPQDAADANGNAFRGESLFVAHMKAIASRHTAIEVDCRGERLPRLRKVRPTFPFDIGFDWSPRATPSARAARS